MSIAAESTSVTMLSELFKSVNDIKREKERDRDRWRERLWVIT